ncbi:MAG TPA: alkaline phosphatase D family protein [Xanthobacteraceae bacterium]|jgi:alkaline phosphatase D|nr:alkaline phosphatase D family protein [Xanthobacteraceae bacterium]
MTAIKRRRALVTRRELLRGSAALAGTSVLTRPALSFAADRPLIPHGLQSGDVSGNSGMVWARSDRPSRMLVEWATTDSFRNVQDSIFVDALPESDFTAKALLEDLPPGQDIFYRISFQDLSTARFGAPQIGSFRSPPNDRRSISFLWSGDTMGQGWGIDTARGGMKTYAAMLANRPDFFIHCGDNIYADCPIPAEQKLPDGTVWRNIVTEEKSKQAETLADYRGNYKYNLLDDNLRAFNAAVPTLALWDNHEVMESWWPGQPLPDKPDGENNTLAFAARARRAFHEYLPTRETMAELGRVYRKISYGPLLDIFMLDMRSYRGPNASPSDRNYGPDDYLLGPNQLAWLKRELTRSRATWKIIAADSPIGYVIDSGVDADGAHGRGLEIADLLSFIKRAGICNIAWITADLHYTAAHYYEPNRATFQDFLPFWEFVSGPLHAGTWTPVRLDRTFGPQVVFHKAPTADQGDNLAPCYGLQFFGGMAIDGATGSLTVTLKDMADRALWSLRLDPAPSAPAQMTMSL